MKFTFPATEKLKNWSFHFKIKAGSDSHDGATGEFVIAFDDRLQTWAIVERDWHEFNGINSRIKASN